MARTSPAVLILLLVNAVVFLAGALVPGWNETLVVQGAFWFPENEAFAPWQPLTYMFLHGDMGHIFFNMFALVSFGALLERPWGSRRFLLFYLLCGLGAGLIQIGINLYRFESLAQHVVEAGVSPEALRLLLAQGYGDIPTDTALKATLTDLYRIYAAPMLGASGAIYGVLVAFGVLYPNAKLALLFVPVPIAAKFFIPALLALDLLSGVTGFSMFGRGVAHFAHLGGAAIGFLLMLFWRDRTRLPQTAAPSPTTPVERT